MTVNNVVDRTLRHTQRPTNGERMRSGPNRKHLCVCELRVPSFLATDENAAIRRARRPMLCTRRHSLLRCRIGHVLGVRACEPVCRVHAERDIAVVTDLMGRPHTVFDQPANPRGNVGLVLNPNVGTVAFRATRCSCPQPTILRATPVNFGVIPSDLGRSQVHSPRSFANHARSAARPSARVLNGPSTTPGAPAFVMSAVQPPSGCGSTSLTRQTAAVPSSNRSPSASS